MKKVVLGILSLSFVGSAAWASGCTTNSSQVISVLKHFEPRVSEQSNATVTHKDETGKVVSDNVSLGDLLQMSAIEKACSSPAYIIVRNPQNNQQVKVTFSKLRGVVYATSSGKRTRVAL